MNRILKDESIPLETSNFELTMAKLIEKRCYTALKAIKEIIESEVFSDDVCYAKIERIVSDLEKLGIFSGELALG